MIPARPVKSFAPGSDRSGIRDDVDGLAAALAAELDRPGLEGEQGVVATATDVHAGVDVGAALADQDLAGVDLLAAEPLDPEPLGGGVANDAHFMGLYIHTALAGTCVITGFADETGAAKSVTLPAATVGFVNFFGAKNAAGALTITCSTAGDDDKVTAFWRPA